MFMTKYNKKAHMRVIRKEAREEAIMETDAKWEKIIAEKDVTISEKDAIIAELKAKLENEIKDAQ